MVDKSEFPRTVEAAVERLLSAIPPARLQEIASMKEGDLPLLHFGLGMWIRNNLGLWGGNSDLVKDTGVSHPDDASGCLIRALWSALNDRPFVKGERTGDIEFTIPKHLLGPSADS